jgi:hypothetical protein
MHRQSENHNFMISGMNLGHLGADFSILALHPNLGAVLIWATVACN